MSAITRVVQGVMNSRGATSKRREPLSPSMGRFLNEFWLRIGENLKLVQGDAISLPLVYHSTQTVYAINLRSALLGLTMDFLRHR